MKLNTKKKKKIIFPEIIFIWKYFAIENILQWSTIKNKFEKKREREREVKRY